MTLKYRSSHYHLCPVCHSSLAYKMYTHRWYCYHCQKYMCGR
ncbi:MAG: hypothetical protein JSV76_03205 [Candidatus Bathyarchaeota archaeon]|nr:MAG: hypothetical protein JSV76_03205 [Candidatus Bathyarchaeota archaeon]